MTLERPGRDGRTMIHPQDCTWDICSLETHDAAYDYRPDLGQNAVLAALFGITLLAQVGLGIRYRTWTFLIAMGFGGLGEVIGYVGRIMSYNNPWNRDAFLTQIVCLTIAPAFYAAAIYLCLSRIVTIFGAKISRIAPVNYTRLFVGCDIVSLLLQSAGGGIAASADEEDVETSDLGSNIMLAGVTFQVITLAVFMGFAVEFGLRVMRNPDKRDVRFTAVQKSQRFRFFLYTLSTATLLIMIRSIYRLIEMAEGWDGELIKNQTLFFILEGVMVSIAVILLSVLHPGMAMKEAFHTAKKLRNGSLESGVELKSSSASVI